MRAFLQTANCSAKNMMLAASIHAFGSRSKNIQSQKPQVFNLHLVPTLLQGKCQARLKFRQATPAPQKPNPKDALLMVEMDPVTRMFKPKDPARCAQKSCLQPLRRQRLQSCRCLGWAFVERLSRGHRIGVCM